MSPRDSLTPSCDRNPAPAWPISSQNCFSKQLTSHISQNYLAWLEFGDPETPFPPCVTPDDVTAQYQLGQKSCSNNSPALRLRKLQNTKHLTFERALQETGLLGLNSPSSASSSSSSSPSSSSSSSWSKNKRFCCKNHNSMSSNLILPLSHPTEAWGCQEELLVLQGDGAAWIHHSEPWQVPGQHRTGKLFAGF